MSIFTVPDIGGGIGPPGPTGPTGPSGPAGAAGGSVVRTYTAGVLLRDVVYQKADGTVDRASASSVGTAILVGVVEAIDSPGVGQCQVRFSGDVPGFAGLIAGQIYVLSTALGGIVGETDTGNPNYPNTATGSGHVMREVGVAASATVLMVGTNRDFMTF